MNLLKSLPVLILFACFTSVAFAQTEQIEEEGQINIPESFHETQEIVDVEGGAGNTTFNLVEDENAQENGAAGWRSYENTEDRRIYSGSHDGNNVIKTIEVKLPEGIVDPYASYRPN
jgi:hypothetical protein